MSTKFDIEEILLGALKSLFVGKRVRVNRSREPRLCTAVEFAYEAFACYDDLRPEFTYEDDSRETALFTSVVEVFADGEITIREARRRARAASDMAVRERVAYAEAEAARETYGEE